MATHDDNLLRSAKRQQLPVTISGDNTGDKLGDSADINIRLANQIITTGNDYMYKIQMARNFTQQMSSQVKYKTSDQRFQTV
jgi:hypothetical protein